MRLYVDEYFEERDYTYDNVHTRHTKRSILFILLQSFRRSDSFTKQNKKKEYVCMCLYVNLTGFLISMIIST